MQVVCNVLIYFLVNDMLMISLTKTYWWSDRISKSPHLEFRFGGFSIVELVVTTGLPRLSTVWSWTLCEWMHRLACLRAVVLHLNLGHKYKLHRLFFGTLSCFGKVWPLLDSIWCLMCLILQKFQYSTTKSNGGKIPQGPTFKAPTVPQQRPTETQETWGNLGSQPWGWRQW